MSQCCGTENLKSPFLKISNILRRMTRKISWEKTFMGRKGRGFDLLDSPIAPQGLGCNRVLAKVLKMDSRPDFQRVQLRLHANFQTPSAGAPAGPPYVEIHPINRIIKSLRHYVMQGRGLLKPERDIINAQPLSGLSGRNT